MRELMFDTSVYGELVDDDEALVRIANHVNSGFIVFGSSTVRRELEETPAVTLVSRGKFKGLNLKELLLWVYRLFVERSGGEVAATDLVEVLALRYQVQLGGVKSQVKTLADLSIVAAASLHGINLFVSADKRQISKELVTAYSAVNAHYQLIAPEFVLYAEFRDSPESYAEAESGRGGMK